MLNQSRTKKLPQKHEIYVSISIKKPSFPPIRTTQVPSFESPPHALHRERGPPLPMPCLYVKQRLHRWMIGFIQWRSH